MGTQGNPKGIPKSTNFGDPISLHFSQFFDSFSTGFSDASSSVRVWMVFRPRRSLQTLAGFFAFRTRVGFFAFRVGNGVLGFHTRVGVFAFRTRVGVFPFRAMRLGVLAFRVRVGVVAFRALSPKRPYIFGLLQGVLLITIFRCFLGVLSGRYLVRP